MVVAITDGSPRGIDASAILQAPDTVLANSPPTTLASPVYSLFLLVIKQTEA